MAPKMRPMIDPRLRERLNMVTLMAGDRTTRQFTREWRAFIRYLREVQKAEREAARTIPRSPEP